MTQNLDGTKRIGVKNVAFNKGYFNITNANEINWTTDQSNRPARREQPATRPADEPIDGQPAERPEHPTYEEILARYGIGRDGRLLPLKPASPRTPRAEPRPAPRPEPRPTLD